ncbi:MAG: glycosyltransferase family 1 protein [Chloroflexota bacterium]|nr:glycosyltransferase family 1 protein [Chloroflexota bacterium]MXX50362.1 glycosyltransferase family 1 protein [Chloroflexota bacterium]MYA94675.1 glycosyltransferase family 1 protein [Chloroflexota bacterium]MYD39296.1 glycosyltransferase family 1 protein [Chloroflexota bacterium]MYE79584.1 glycosyltransferase family 1 protein [Chloroflexota bacterium]
MQTQRLLTQLQAQQNAAVGEYFGNPSFADVISASATFSRVRRVAVVTESFLPKVDGVVKTAYLSLRYLQDTGREVLVFAPDIAVDHVGASQVIPLPSISLPQAPETRMALPNPLVARHIEAFQPDLIHLFSPAAMAVSGMAAGRHLNLPVIANYQTDLPGYTEQYGFPRLSGSVNRWLRYIHNGCHLTLAPTRTTIRQLRREGFRRVRHWGRGVDTARFNPRWASVTMRRRLLNDRDPDSLLCIYVGRLATEKRIDLLLELAQTPGVALTIIGDGAQREQLEALYVDTDVHFTGYLIGDELAQAYASADVFVFPGEYETFGQVIQEAMASGLPCIVVDAGGAPDVIDDGASGLVVAPTAAAFAEAVCSLRDQTWLRSRLAVRARALAEARPWSALMAQLERYYEEAYWLNRRFARRFGSTRYHQPLSIPAQLVRRPRGLS